MATRSGRFSSLTRRLFGSRPATRGAAAVRGSVGKQFVELEQRAVPATFVVTNILDNQTDVVGGLSLRQAIYAANGNPGFDQIVFNIPRSPSLPTIPNDPTENYFPIVLASTLPDLTDPAGVSIDGFTQPRNNFTGTRPIIQLLPDPNPGAFPGQKGAFYISGGNNVIRGLVITGFPGAALNIVGPQAHDNVVVGTWINTDITGTKPWSEDPFIASARPPGTPPELTNTGPLPNKLPLFVLGGITLTNGAHDNIIGGTIDENAQPLADSGGNLIGLGGVLTRFDNMGNLVSTGIPVDATINRNIISGTPHFKKSYFDYDVGNGPTARADDIEGAGVGPGIRIMDPGTDRNLIQGNFIGTDVSGNLPIPNHNGIEIFNTASSNLIGNPTTQFTGDPVQAGVGNLIRFNENDGIRLADTPNPSQYTGATYAPFLEGEDFFTVTAPGPFGPINAAGTLGTGFFDSLNPNYFHGASPTSPNILTVDRTTFDFDATDKVLDPGNAVTAPGVSGQVGATITLRGSGLLATSAVTFNSSTVSTANPQTVPAKFVVVSDGELRVTIPLGAATPPKRVAPNADIPAINVFTPAGVAKLMDAVILPSPPTQVEVVSTFAPSTGLAGSIVSIFGTNFVGAQSVSIGGVLATNFTVLPGGNQIDVVVPTGAQSGVITVITPGGAVSTTRAFRVETQPPPVVTAFDKPAVLPGEQVLLTGANFTGAYLVRFNWTGGASGFTTTNFKVLDENHILATVPALATASTNPVEVVTNDGFGGSSAVLQILTPSLPVIGGLSTASGPIGTSVTITGSKFTSTTRVTFSGIDAQKFTIVDDNTITAVVPFGLPPGISSVVRVVNVAGNTVSPTNFGVTASLPPTIGSIPFAFRNNFTVVNGTNLLGTTKVLFGNAITGTPAVTFEVLSDTQIRVQIPPAVASNGTFFLYTAYNTQNPLQPPVSNLYAVADTVQPTIGTGRQSDPISGIIGSLVTLRGSGFLGTQNVFFPKDPAFGGGLVPANNLTIVNDGEITFTVPNLAVSGNIIVDTPGVPDTNAPFDPADPIEQTTIPYTILPSPAPTFVSRAFYPVSGPVGTFMTLSGTGFTGAVQVAVGGGIVDNFTVESDNIITFRVPILAADGPITVTTVGGTVATLQSFDVTDAPAPTVFYSTPRAARNTQVTIAGTGLASTSKVLFNTVPAQFTIISDTLITAIVPLAAAPGEIRVFTAGGDAGSPTPFALTNVAAPRLAAVGAFQRDETMDAAPVGSKIEINASSVSQTGDPFNINTVFEVDFAPVGGGPASGVAADFEYGGGGLIVTIPELPPGEYEVQVYAAVTNPATVADGNFGGSWWDTSYSEWTNILGSTFKYGETMYVLPAARPVVTSIVTNDTTDGVTNVAPERGVPITIRGSGFTGANFIRFYTDFAANKFVNVTNPALFTVLSDNAILTTIPIGKLPGTAAIDDMVVQVFTPNGVVGDTTDDLGSLQSGPEAQVDVAATAAFTFDASAGNGAFFGSTIPLIATSGNWYSATKLLGNAFDTNGDPPGTFPLGTNVVAPQVSPINDPTMPLRNITIVPDTGGLVALAIVPIFNAIPDAMIVVPPGAPPTPVPPPGADVYLSAVTAGGTVAANDKFVVARPDPNTVTIFNFASDIGGNEHNRTFTVTGNQDMISTSGITVTMDSGGTVTVGRNNIEVIDQGFGIVTAQFVMPIVRNPFIPQLAVDAAAGDIQVNTPDDQATASYTVIEQPAPRIFIFDLPHEPPQDNRIVSNRVYDNGLTIVRDPVTGFAVGVTLRDQTTKFTDGNLGIDFVTHDPNNGGFPFVFGFATIAQPGPPLTPPPGNEGRGGLNDGSPPDNFILPPAVSALPTNPLFTDIALPTGQLFSTGKNTFNNTQYGRYFGPNLLQNFPLLQVVQSSIDRTTFSTALLGKPYRSYRIDYYYNAGVDNPLSDAQLDPFLASQSAAFSLSRFDDQDKAARATTNIGSGQIYLGSKVIVTDGFGDGSVSFNVYRRLPTDPNDPTSLPPLQPGDFNLPDNLPLVPSIVDPVTGNVVFRAGVVTATATDLTAAGPLGPILTEGPDGTSRFSFFKRVDTPTGSISGRVILDSNKNGVTDNGEPGVANATVSIFVQRDDGSYNATPTTQIVTGDDGSYIFGQSGTGGGYGLPNGTHKLVLTLPTGGTTTYFYEVPADGKRSITILGGAVQNNIDFLVITTPPGTPPTISDIGNQVVPVGTVVGPIGFTVNDAETPANLLTLTAISSDNVFIPVSSIVFGGSGTNRTVTVTLPPGISGSATITVTVTDGSGLTASDSFTIIAGAIGPNTPPTISPIAPQTVTPGGSTGVLNFTVGDVETAPGALVVQQFTSNPALVPIGNIVFGGSGANRTVNVTTLPGIIGSATITIVVTDGGGLTSQTEFTVTVPPPPGTAPHLLVVGSDAGRTAQVNVYNPNGSFRYTLTPYGDGFTGGVRVATGDVTGDGNADVITAPGIGIPGLVKIYDGITGTFITQYLPYGETFKGGVYVVTGDNDGDGILDLITGTGKGGGPRVRIVQGGMSGGTMGLTGLADFFPYESSFRGGVLVAAGYVNGDNIVDIVTGTGVTGAPRVRVLDGTKLQSDEFVPPSQVGAGTLFDFFAYDNRFRGGVFASVGDVDNDGQAEIITGTGFGGGPHVKIFKQAALLANPTLPADAKSFFAYDPSFNGGVRVDVIDGNNDGIPDIITGPGAGVGPDVRVINYATLQDIYRVQAFEATFKGGVFVGGNID